MKRNFNSVNKATMLTENAYGLCDQHLQAWRDGGNTVDAWPIEDDDPEHFGMECVDCAEYAELNAV